MHNHYVFIEFDAGIRFDFSEISDDKNHSLYLIVSEKNYTTLSQAALYSFREIIVINESQFDCDKLLSMINKIISQFNISKESLKIVTHDEYSIGVCAKLRERLGLDGDRYHEVAKFTNKLLMKEAAAGLRLPKHCPFSPERFNKSCIQYIDSIIDQLGLPVFIKPINRASCFETSIVKSKNELYEWAKSHKNDDYFEIDEYITGDLYHCDSIIQDGEIKKVFVAKYNTPCADFSKGKPMGSIILIESHPLYKKLVDYNSKVLATIGMPNNVVTHMEFFQNKKGEFIFLEIAARAPGAEAPFVYKKMTGKNVEEILVRLQMGLNVDLDFKEPKVYAAFMRFPRKSGKVATVNRPNIKSHYNIRYFIDEGDSLQQAENLSDIAAVVVLWNPSYEQLHKDFCHLANTAPYKLEELSVDIDLEKCV